MKKILLIFIITIFSLNKSFAITLTEALIQTYKNNTELNAERENIKVSREDLKISKSSYLPTLTITGSKSIEETKKLTNQSGGDASISDVDPFTTSIKLEQTLVDLGRNADFKKNQIGINLAEAKLLKKEQDILYEAINSYTGLILSNEKSSINDKNVNLLERQVETDRIRLDRGEITFTDLAQSESSLAGAKAQLIAAQNDLVVSKANFEKIIGKKPSENIQEIKSIKLNLPESLAAAYSISNSENPDLQIATIEFKQSKLDVIIAGSELSPSATLSYKIAEQDDVSATVKDRTQQTVTATATWPLFSGGSNIFNLRKAQELRNQKELLLEDSKKSNETDVANAWSQYQSSKSVLDSIRSQVKAAEIANEGITLEYESGTSRTTMEVIQSRSILLNSRINLASSERNFLVSQFNLLSAVGRLTAGHLNLKK